MQIEIDSFALAWYRSKTFMRHRTIFSVFGKFATVFIVATLVSCTNNTTKFKHGKYYRAINGKDTALLSLSIDGDDFYGQYEIRDGRIAKDSGDVSGKIIGDTFLGTYFYHPYSGQQKKRVPFALLRKDGTLLLGKGAVTSYVGIPYYVPEIGIDFKSPEFIFSLDSLGN